MAVQQQLQDNSYRLILVESEEGIFGLKEEKPKNDKAISLGSLYVGIAGILGDAYHAGALDVTGIDSLTFLSKRNKKILKSILLETEMHNLEELNTAEDLYESLYRCLSANYILLNFLLKKIEENVESLKTPGQAVLNLKRQKADLDVWLTSSKKLENNFKQGSLQFHSLNARLIDNLAKLTIAVPLGLLAAAPVLGASLLLAGLASAVAGTALLGLSSLVLLAASAFVANVVITKVYDKLSSKIKADSIFEPKNRTRESLKKEVKDFDALTATDSKGLTLDNSVSSRVAGMGSFFYQRGHKALECAQALSQKKVGGLPKLSSVRTLVSV